MKIDKSRPKLAAQLAGHIPVGAEIIGIIEDLPGRNQEILIKHRTGIYSTLLGGVSKSIDPKLVRDALDK